MEPCGIGGMAGERRTRAWWLEAVGRWRRSGLTVSEFAAQEGLQPRTLQWWSSQLRGTRAKHGRTAVIPIEISVPRGEAIAVPSSLVIAVGDAVLRCEVGTDVSYVASLVRALRGT